MAFDFQFPDVGEGIHEGKIVKWLVKEGDAVKADQSIAEVETDKAIVEIPTPKSGTITKLYHAVGDVMKVGEVMMTLELAAGSAVAQPAPVSAAPVSAAKAAEPVEEKRESSGVVGALEETAPGVLKAPSLNMSGAVFGGGTPAGISATTPPKPASVAPAQKPTATAAPSQPATGGVGVVKSGIKSVKKYDLFGYVDRAPYDSVRKAVGDHMVKSMFTIPHVTHTDLADVNDLFKIREKEKIKAEKEGIKLTFLPFFLKATVAALKKHPYVNASLDEQEGVIILKKYFNIGMAVDTEAGLMVPVIKGVDKKSIFQLAKEIKELAEKARSRKINPMDFKGGTFTITNIGSAGGGLYATPVINFPEAAILGTGMIQDMAVPRNGKVVIRKMLPLSLSFDHRIFDGAEAARFVMTLRSYLEAPDSLLVEGE